MNIIINCSAQDNSIGALLLAIAPIIVAIVAIIVPAAISVKQNKIALYEKRFECYQQLESLKTFWNYLKEVTSITSAAEDQTHSVWTCQQYYFNAHSLLDDEDFQRNRFKYFHQNAYARFCLEIDSKMLLSLKLLVADENEEAQIDNVKETLETFVVALFGQQNDDDLMEKKNQFVKEYEKLLPIENKLVNLLKIAKKRNHICQP